MYFFKGANREIAYQMNEANAIWGYTTSTHHRDDIDINQYPVTQEDFEGTVDDILAKPNITKIIDELHWELRYPSFDRIITVYYLPLSQLGPHKGYSITRSFNRGDKKRYHSYIFLSTDRQDALLAHELGHSLFCGNHETQCADPENPLTNDDHHNADPNNIMYPSMYEGPLYPLVTDKQKEAAKNSFFNCSDWDMTYDDATIKLNRVSSYF